VAFELTELSTRNLVGVYSTQDAALRDVAEAIRRGGADAVATLALAMDDPTGETDGSIIAEGAALAEMVLHSRPAAA
jgi:hypothetical protein